jgi:hypothetical protein
MNKPLTSICLFLPSCTAAMIATYFSIATIFEILAT